ncbi:MAG: hypothetical protein ACOCWQ_01435 [Nanoarchaeota archaeon]
MRQPKPIWYLEMGFRHNPFSIKPGVIYDNLIGQQEVVDSVQECISGGNRCMVVGRYGVGKTTFLKSVISRFAGRRRVIYFACNRLHGPLNLDRLLYERFGVLGKMLKIRSRNMILLLDEAEHLTVDDHDAIDEYVRKGYFQSIVYVTHDIEEIQAEGAQLDDLKRNLFYVTMFNEEEAISLIRNRLHGKEFLPRSLISEIYERSENSRKFLKNCEDVCRHAFLNGHKRVTRKDIRESVGVYA